jgi:hypothetical protein
LPVLLGDPFHFENDARFCHEAEYGWIAKSRKPALFKLAHHGQSFLDAIPKP